ncbi:hypothetical protein LXL04_002202 [Taraxacum kok-saghyz]
MAEANPKSNPNDGGDPPNKNNTTSSTAASGSRPTATSKPNKGGVEEINFPNSDILVEVLAYKDLKGVDPSHNPDTLREFCTPFIQVNVGNARGWIRRLREIKNKFNNDSAPTEDVDKKEFEMWKKIWGNDDDPSAGSSK